MNLFRICSKTLFLGKDIPASHLIAALLPNDSSPEALNELADLEKIISDRISELSTDKERS